MTDGDYEDQLSAEDMLLDDEGLEDELDRGYSPPEKWSAAEGYGNTPWEEAHGESLDQRVRQEEPEPDPYAADRDEDETDMDGGQVGDLRSGRLVAPDQGLGEDEEKDSVASDVGIDGAAASAEEAAMHVLDEDPTVD
jgi:hypothetical protein